MVQISIRKAQAHDRGTVKLATAVVTIMLLMGLLAQPARTPAERSNPAAPLSGSVTAVIHDPDCPLYFELPNHSFSYGSIEEAVKDTIPGEWWPPNGYGYPMYNGALKSASIIIRTRIKYHTEHPWSGWPQGMIATAGTTRPASVIGFGATTHRMEMDPMDQHGQERTL